MNRKLKIIFLLFGIFFIFSGTGAHAAGYCPTTDPDYPNCPQPTCTGSSINCILDNFEFQILGINGDYLTNSGAPLVAESCTLYTGFFNKIVNCVTRMVTREAVLRQVIVLYNKFVGAAIAVLICYIAIFGLKLSLNALENARGEIILVILTCFFFTYLLNISRIDKFIFFFTGLQNEFAAVSTAAIFSKETSNLTYDQANCVASLTQHSQFLKCNDIANNSKYICYGPPNANGRLEANNRYNVWQRMDCLFAWIVGAHPLVQRMGQYFDEGGTGEPLQIDTSNLTNNFQNFNQRYSYGLRFRDMATDPYCFFSYRANLDFLDNPGASTTIPDGHGGFKTASQAFYDDAQLSQDGCIRLLSTKSVDELKELARVIKNDKYEVFIVFSSVVIGLGMLFNDPSIGLLVFLTGFFVLILMLAAFAQAALIYISSYIAILFLGLLAPLAIPCFLFQYTRKLIFEKWVQLLFVYTIQPGLVLSYITFMMAVIQFTLTYKPDNPDPSKPAPVSQVELQNGDSYKQGDTNPAPVVQASTNVNNEIYHMTIAENEESSAQVIPGDAENSPEYFYNYTNFSDEQYATYATQQLKQSPTGVFGNMLQFPTSGRSAFSIKLPAFHFCSEDFKNKYNTCDLQTAIKQVLVRETTVDPGSQYNQNVPQSVQLSGYNPTMQKKVDDVVKDYYKYDFPLKIGYMQSLLIILIAMAICFSFLNNVIRFGAQLAGVSVIPVSKLSNVYDLVSRKLTRVLEH